MNFIIKEWPDKSATLMTENGYNLATFNSLCEAPLGLWRMTKVSAGA